MLVRISLLSLTVFAFVLVIDAGSAADKDKPAPAEKQRREEIDKLIKQLNADDFKLREAATRQLMKRDDALPALQEAAKSDDAEVSRRARALIEAINKRVGKRAIARAIAKLKKGQTDQFVDAVVQWREYADEGCWKAALAHAQAIADKAGKLNGGREYKASFPRCELSKLKLIRKDHLRMPKEDPKLIFERQRVIAESVTIPDNTARDAFLICGATLELEGQQPVLAWSVVFVNGDLKIGDGILGDSIVVCDGNVTVAGFVHDCVILATGTVRVGSVVNDSVILGGSEVKVGVDLAPGNGQGVPVKNSVIRPHQRDPLDFIHFWDLAEQGIKVKASRQEVRVEEVTAGKCFAQAGVRKGDRLVAVEGVKVVSAEGLRRLLRRRIQESKVIRLEIRREEKQLQMDMHVSGDAP